MTPQQCVAARARLGWTRQDLAAATALAAPIIRLFEAGALEGFDDCAEAIKETLDAAEAARARPLARKRPREGRLVWLVEARRRWQSQMASDKPDGLAEAGATYVAAPAAGWAS